MKRTERIVIYSALTILAAINAVFLLSHSGQTAMAEVSAWLDKLGPAESVTLMDDSKELVIRNKAGRLNWGDGDFKQAYTVGFVDISKALNPLMESKVYSEERDALRKKLEETESEYKTKLDAFGEEIQNMDRDTPAGKEKLDEARKLYAEYMKWRQEVAIKESNDLDVKHLQQAYRELVSAVNVVADKLHVDIVLRFIATDKDFKAQDAESALTEIRLRTAVKYPEKLDITSEVLQELSLQDKG